MSNMTTETADDGINGKINRLRNSRAAKATRTVVFENRLAQFGLFIILLTSFVAIFAPYIAPYDPTTQNIATAQLEPPSAEHPMGTDQFGRDVFSRVIFGARISLQVGVGSVALALVAGVPLGLVSGYYKGYVDEAIMRFIDIVLAFPALIIGIAVVAVLGPSLINVAVAVGIVYIPRFARIARSGVLSVREEEYVTAARAIGDTDRSIIAKDVLPNTVAPIIVQASISLALAILIESALSFIGLGAPPPTPSWGRMLSNSRDFMQQAWWTVTFPGLAIMLAILGYNILGDALRDILDPKHDTKEGGNF